jgi:hypothetical protein
VGLIRNISMINSQVDVTNKILVSNSLQYHEIIILLYRPFLGHSDPQASDASSRFTPFIARQSCFQAASDICNILTVYRRYYGLRRVHIQMVHVVMTAALIHSYFDSGFAGKDEPRAQEFLLNCLQALGEMGQTYRTALRALEVVVALRNSWRNEATPLKQGVSQIMPPA